MQLEIQRSAEGSETEIQRETSPEKWSLDGGNPITEAIVTREGGDVPRSGGKGGRRAARRGGRERSEGDARSRERIKRLNIVISGRRFLRWDRHGSMGDR